MRQKKLSRFLGSVFWFMTWMLAVSAVIAACQTTGSQKTVSVEEAKQITATFEGQSFVPPPRTITDILEVIHGNQAQAEARRREWQAVIESSPPQGATNTALAEFYIQRAGARSFLGQVAGQLSDLEKAEQLAHSDRKLTADIYQALGIAHVHGANYRLGLEYRRRGLGLLDRNIHWGALLNHNAALASFEAYLGNLAAAESHMEEARRWEATIPQWKKKDWANFGRSYSRASEAQINLNRGSYGKAEALLRESITIAERELQSGADSSFSPTGLDLGHLLRYLDAQNHSFMAMVLMREGRLAEAEDAARIGVERAVGYFGRLSIPTAEVLRTLTLVLLEQDRLQDAEDIARENVKIYQEMGAAKESLFFNNVRVALAETLVAQGSWQEVLEIYQAIERDMASEREIFEHVISANASWAIAQIVVGDAKAVVNRLTPAYAQRQRDLGDTHVLTAETGGLLAAALVATGRSGEALPIFERILAVFASNSRDSSEEGVTQTARDRRIAFILEANLAALAASGAGEAAADEALRVAGLAQGRSVQRAVLSAAARATIQDPELAELVRQEQDARKQIGALYGTLANMMNTPPDRRDTTAENQLRSQIDDLRSARAALAQEIEARFPDYAALVNPDPPGVAAVQQALAPGEALVATYVGERASYVWAVPKSGAPQFREVAAGADSVFSGVQRLRQALAPNASTLGEIPAFDVGLAHAVYSRFLEPVEAGWRDADTLLVVADGPLGQLPPGVLVTEATAPPRDGTLLFEGYKDVPWLAREHAITVLPSVASLVALRALPAGRQERRPFVGFGDPVFQAAAQPAAQLATAAPETAVAAETAVESRGLPVTLRSLPNLRGVSSAQLAMLPRLPDTAEEVESIALAMNADLTRDVFVGAAANEQQVKTMQLSGYRVIAFATHGLVPGDLDGLTQPALALSSPQAAGIAGDGLLTMEEILALRLDADWVVLSACNTGSAQGAGAEAVSGLGRAFFYAGTRALLVSNWPVETTSAKTLTTDIFRRQAEQPGLGRAAALQQAMLELIDGPGYLRESDGTAVFSYAHPIFWAPFSLIGDGGGEGPGV